MTPVNTIRWWRQIGTGPSFFTISRRLYTTVGELRAFIREQRLATRPAVMTHPDRWRLDQLLTWEERRMAMAEAALQALVHADHGPEAVADLLPQPKRRRLA